MNKCVFILGPESSGSKLIARICSHVLTIQKYGDWKGNKCSDNGNCKVCHYSLPNGLNPPVFPDVSGLIASNTERFDIYFVLTTRDMTISELSRQRRFGKLPEQVAAESAAAREILANLLNSGQKCFIWSYETFVFLGDVYLQQLYAFLGVDSDFAPLITDGNQKYIT